MISRVKVNARLRIKRRTNYIRPLTKSDCLNLVKKAFPQMKVRQRKMKMLEALCNRTFPPNLSELQYQSQSKRPTMIVACLHLLLALHLISQECKMSRLLMRKVIERCTSIKMPANQFWAQTSHCHDHAHLRVQAPTLEGGSTTQAQVPSSVAAFKWMAVKTALGRRPLCGRALTVCSSRRDARTPL